MMLDRNKEEDGGSQFIRDKIVIAKDTLMKDFKENVKYEIFYYLQKEEQEEKR